MMMSFHRDIFRAPIGSGDRAGAVRRHQVPHATQLSQSLRCLKSRRLSVPQNNVELPIATVRNRSGVTTRCGYDGLRLEFRAEHLGRLVCLTAAAKCGGACELLAKMGPESGSGIVATYLRAHP